MYGAWQHARFAREEKLKPWSSYARQAARAAKPQRAQRPAEMLANFQAIAASGIALKIRRIG